MAGMPRRLVLIGAPTSAGSYAPGQEAAPRVLRARPSTAFLATLQHLAPTPRAARRTSIAVSEAIGIEVAAMPFVA